MTPILVARFAQDEQRIAAMSCRGLTVIGRTTGAFAALAVDSRGVIRAIAGQQKSFPQNIRVPTE
jgi:tagatose-1,6-bisphosphate aldolase